MQKKYLLIMFFFILLAVAAVFFYPSKKPLVENKGISISNIKAGDRVSSPLKIKGTISGDKWIAFEGQAGVVRLVDKDNKELALAILKTEEDWMKVSVSFEADLEFSVAEDGTYNLVFKNENPSGLLDNEREFIIPVYIKQGKMIVKAYFNNSKLDPEASCNKVFAVEREIDKTLSTARTAIEELLKGPTDKEKSEGYFTSINTGVKIQKLVIEEGIAKIDFDSQLEYQVGGSCRVSAIRTQITETLKQFSTVKSVLISIDGRTEDILQP